MRITGDMFDRNRWRPFYADRPLHRCLVADTDDGEAEILILNGGHLLRDPETGEAASYTLHGPVTLRPEPEHVARFDLTWACSWLRTVRHARPWPVVRSLLQQDLVARVRAYVRTL